MQGCPLAVPPAGSPVTQKCHAAILAPERNPGHSKPLWGKAVAHWHCPCPSWKGSSPQALLAPPCPGRGKHSVQCHKPEKGAVAKS